MGKALKRVKLSGAGEIVNAVREMKADHDPRLLETDGEAIAVLLTPEDYEALVRQMNEQLWADYDPEAARAAIRRAAGALRGVDPDELLRDIYEARGQSSSGRP